MRESTASGCAMKTVRCGPQRETQKFWRWWTGRATNATVLIGARPDRRAIPSAFAAVPSGPFIKINSTAFPYVIESELFLVLKKARLRGQGEQSGQV